MGCMGWQDVPFSKIFLVKIRKDINFANQNTGN